MEQKVNIPLTPMKKVELALVGLVQAKKARLHHVALPMTGDEGAKIFKFYKLDCPEPNMRKDGSVWPNPPGTRIKLAPSGRRKIIPQEEIY
jgi:hypothetical protein